MNNQVLFVSVLLLSVSVAILFYQNVKLSRKLDRELGTVNKNMTDMSKMIALNNNINLVGGEHPNMMDAPPVGDVLEGAELNGNVNLEPRVTEEFKQEINQLKTDYQDYELSSELKNEIDNLERMEGMPESLELSKENLEELQNAQMEELRELETAKIEAVTELEAVADSIEAIADEEGVTGSGEMVIETLETGEEDLNDEECLDDSDELVETNLDNQIVDWNNEVQNGDGDEDEDEVQEVVLDGGNLNPPESISLDSGDIRAEVTQGVNELVGNIIASASDVEVVHDENVIKLSNDGDSVSVTINNEQRTLEDLNGTELKDVCKYFNLKGKGKKIELIERIKDYQINLKNSKNFFVLGN